MTDGQAQKLAQRRLLAQAITALEDLLLSGTTTVSNATQRTLSSVFEQAAKVGLLRLGAALRIVLEEIKRLHADPERFSSSRYCFFVDRSWLLASGSLAAIEREDEQALIRLTASTRSFPLPLLEVATVGVLKRHVPGAFSAFEFRLRLLAPIDLDSGERLAVGTSLVWSLVVPAAPGHQFPAEAFLSMRQKQGFSPTDLLAGKPLQISCCRLADGDPRRVQLGPDSRVEKLDRPPPDWSALVAWEPKHWLQRLRAHRPDPLELPIDLSQDVLLHDWSIDKFAPSTVPGRQDSERCATIEALGSRWRLRVDRGDPALEQALRGAASAIPQPALYASAHVELGEAVLSPLALLGATPEYITIGKPEFDRAALVRLLNRS